MNRLAYSPFNHDEPRTVEELAEFHQSLDSCIPPKTFSALSYTAGYKQAAQDAQAEITRLNTELKLAYRKIQELG